MILLAAACLLLSANSASAATRYASPTGVASADCYESTPCDIYTAIVDAPDYGDEVVLAPGNYGSPASPLTTVLLSTKVARIAPRVGAARPHLYIGGSGFISIYNGGELADVDIDSTSTGSSGAVFAYSSTIQRLVVRSTTGKACRLYHGSTILNSICATTAPGTPAVELDAPSGFPANALLRNVTAWSGGPGGIGFSALSRISLDPTVLGLQITNSILHGTSIDLQASTDSSAGTSLTATADHSNFKTVLATGSAVSVTPAGSGTNQTADPVLASPAAFDFDEMIGSPTIDAGVTDLSFGTLDALHGTRVQGASTDIGAVEFMPQASAITAMKVKPSKFRAAKKGAMIAVAKAKKSPVGGKLTLALNMTSVVAIAVERATTGRKGSGGKCAVPSRKNRTGKRCTRFVKVGKAINLTLPTGASSKSLSGRVSKKKLKSGKYRVRAIPTAFGAPPGPPAYAKFTIVR